jgi:hypothetical protein
VGYFLLQDEAKRLPTLSPVHRPVPLAPAPLAPVAALQPNKPLVKPVYDEPAPVPVPVPLPDLSQSDAALLAEIQGLHSPDLLALLIPQDLLRKFVRALVLLEEGKVVAEYRPFVAPQGSIVVEALGSSAVGSEPQQLEQFRLSPKNALRYGAYVMALSALDSPAAVALYRRYYPLLSQAYEEMGAGNGKFHSVLIRAIDQVLAAPDAAGDLLLIHPKVYYQFADPALEQLPEVHKLMLRMGPENAARVKVSLGHLRQSLLQK